MAKNVCYAAQAVLHDRERQSRGSVIFSPVAQTAKQEREAHGGSTYWHKSGKDLWKLKCQQPHLFARQQQHLNIEISPDTALPPGFEKIGRCGWLFNSERQLYFHRADSRYLWFDKNSGSYRELECGFDFSEELSVIGSAARLGTMCNSGNAPRHVAIMDLHRAADAFKLDISHLDRPSAMLAVYGGTTSEISAEVVARSFHEKLLKHLSSYRARWSDEDLKVAMLQTFLSLSDDHGADKNVVASVALQLGSRIVTSVGHTGACVVFDPDGCDVGARGNGEAGVLSSLNANGPGCHTACVEVAHRGMQCIILSTLPLEQEIVTAAAAHIAKGHPKAASVRIVQSLKGSAGAAGAAACAKLLWAPSSGPAAKRARVETGAELAKVRCRQILLKYVGCKQPRDAVRRKPISRSAVEAEIAMLEVLDEIETADSTVDVAFTQRCRAISECSSSLKARDLAGDIGWLTRPVEKVGEKLSKEQTSKNTLIRAALELKVGELSDILVSEDGVHLFQRIA